MQTQRFTAKFTVSVNSWFRSSPRDIFLNDSVSSLKYILSTVLKAHNSLHC